MAMRRLVTPEPVLIPSNARAEGKSHTEHEKDIPIIICTGIHGRVQEVTDFAAALDKVYQGNSPIYICKSSFPDNRDVKNITDAILRARNYSLYPCILIGFSYGSLLASKIAETLRYEYPERSYESIFCGIDALSPEHTLNYFDSNDIPSANLNLLDIMNYAANIAGLTPLTATPETFEDLKLYCIERKFVELTAKIIEAQRNPQADNLRRFTDIIEVVKQNIEHLIKFSPYIQNKLKTGNFFFTDEIKQRLFDLTEISEEDFTGGWEACCDRVKAMHTKDGGLEKLTHLDLMKKENVDKLARLIFNSIANEVNLTLKSVAPHIIKKTFQSERVDQQYVDALKVLIPTFVKNTFGSLLLDAKTISEIASEAIQLFSDEILFLKQTGLHCNMYKPASALRKSQNDASNTVVAAVTTVDTRPTSPFTVVKVN